MKRRWVVPVVLIAGLAIMAGLWWRDNRTLSLAQGRHLYDIHCAACHGVELEGQPDWRQRRADGKLPAPPHDATGHTWHHPDGDLFAMTKFGVAPFAPAGYASDMPAFAGILDDAEIRAILGYIKSRWPEDIQRRQRALSERGR